MTLQEFLDLAQRTAQDLADLQQSQQQLTAAQAARAQAGDRYTQDRAGLAAALESLYPVESGAGQVQASAPAAAWPSLPSLPSPERLADLYRQLTAALSLLRSLGAGSQ